MNKLKIKKGFTLVELIIVITILVILATIAFVSFQNYTKDARDSNRLMSIKNIQNGLEGFQIKTGIYPEPENSIDIMVGSSIISKQGYFGESQSDIINIDKLPLDPLDGTKYIYSINNNKNKYQLLSYLEANYQLSFVNETYADDLSKRNLKSFGNDFGIVLDESNNNITKSVDIVNSTGVYKVILDNSSSGTFIGTGLTLSQINPIASCKKIFENGNKKDGVYQINPLGGDGFDVYCDMTTDGGGWTLIFNMEGVSTYNKVHSGSIYNDFLNSTGVSLAYSNLPLGDDLILELSENKISGSIKNNNKGRIDMLKNISLKGKSLHYHANGESNINYFSNNTVYKNIIGKNLYTLDYGSSINAKRLCINDKETNTTGFILGHCPALNSAGWPNYTNYNLNYNSHWSKYLRIWTR